jgi:hypothetical protein
VLNPEAAEALRNQLTPETADLVLNAIRGSLSDSLHLVFFIGSCVMLVGFVSSIVWREIPMRRRPEQSRTQVATVAD